MLQVNLATDAQHLVQIDPLDVFGQGLLPSGAPKVIMKLVEIDLYMVWDAASESPTHELRDLGRKIDFIRFSQGGQAADGSMFVPWMQVVGREDVGVSAQAGLLQQRFKSDAAGEDHGHAPAMGLAVAAQPAQKRVREHPSFRRDAIRVALEQPVDEDGQFVDRQHDRFVARGQRSEDSVAPVGPVAGVDPGPKSYLQVGNRQLFDPVSCFSEHVDETGFDPIEYSVQVPGSNADFGDRIGRVGSSFYVDEDRFSLASDLEASQQFAYETRLPMRRCAVSRV